MAVSLARGAFVRAARRAFAAAPEGELPTQEAFEPLLAEERAITEAAESRMWRRVGETALGVTGAGLLIGGLTAAAQRREAAAALAPGVTAPIDVGEIGELTFAGMGVQPGAVFPRVVGPAGGYAPVTTAGARLPGGIPGITFAGAAPAVAAAAVSPFVRGARWIGRELLAPFGRGVMELLPAAIIGGGAVAGGALAGAGALAGGVAQAVPDITITQAPAVAAAPGLMTGPPGAPALPAPGPGAPTVDWSQIYLMR